MGTLISTSAVPPATGCKWKLWENSGGKDWRTRSLWWGFRLRYLLAYVRRDRLHGTCSRHWDLSGSRRWPDPIQITGHHDVQALFTIFGLLDFTVSFATQNLVSFYGNWGLSKILSLKPGGQIIALHASAAIRNSIYLFTCYQKFCLPF